MIYRARIKKDIICEFLPPAQPSRRVIIFARGMPGSPGSKQLMEFYSQKNFWVFLPRYKGSWESGGKFLARSPHLDIVDVIDQLPKGFIELWAGKKFVIKNPEIYLIGSSFGGPAVLLNSKDRRVKKVVAISPVIDWRADGKITKVARFVARGYGLGYRPTKNAWQKIQSGMFYNPTTALDKIDGDKIFIIHAKDDEVVSYKPTVDFCKKTGTKLELRKTGGHLGTSVLITPGMYKKIKNFFAK